MANEILALEQDPDGPYTALFLFPVTAPKANVVPTPSTELPPVAQAVLTAPEQAALDAGTAAFLVISFVRDPGLTGPALLAHVQGLYALRKAEFDADYAVRYQFTGNRYDAA